MSDGVKSLYIEKEKQFYYIIRKSKKKSVYRCTARACKSQVTISATDCFKEKIVEHNHKSNDEEKYKRYKEKALMIRKVKEFISQSKN